jgi:hypothetical protein
LLLQTGGAPILLRNDESLKNNWLRLKLVGKKSNRDAIGAWAEVKVGGKTLQRQVTATRSYLSQSELPLTFGLGKETSISSLKIHWPSGAEQNIDDSSRLAGMLGKTTTIEEAAN